MAAGATGATGAPTCCFLCVHADDLLNQLDSSTSCPLRSTTTQGTRAALLLLLIAAPGWRSDYWDTSPSVCRLMRPARVHRMWGRKRSTREGRREGLWVELSNGPSEGKGLNIDGIIYMFYLTTGSACLRRNMLGPSHPGPARRSHAILKRLGVKEQYNVT